MTVIKKISKDNSKTISFDDNLILPVIFGEHDKYLKVIETELEVQILPRGNFLKILGKNKNVNLAKNVLIKLYNLAVKSNNIDEGEIIGTINILKNTQTSENSLESERLNSLSFSAGKKVIKPRSRKQLDYFDLVKKKQMVFCCGPAGTGKTYLAVAFAVSMLKSGQIDKIILSRPAVEAGERLGFLPGDLKEKIDPYLTPLYDALRFMLPSDKLKLFLESRVIEIAPLAYMRGRTLHNAFMILDEAQNATKMQMKMFLTRLGVTSKAIITGDITQIDLPPSDKSGLIDAINVLKNVNGISFVEFDSRDVVRHELVKKIISAYAKKEKIKEKKNV